MYQCSLFEVEQELLQTLPKSGTIVNGKLSEQTKWELGIEERESGSWPTPTTKGYGHASEGQTLMIRKKVEQGIITESEGQQMLGGTTLRPPRMKKWNFPTPTTQETEHPQAELTKTGRRKTKDGKNSHSLNLADTVRMFPTPTTADTWTDKLKSSQQKEGSMHSVNLSQAVHMKEMFPTPTSSDHKGWSKGHKRAEDLSNRLDFAVEPDKGVGGTLNPMWVEWLMGFPIGWTDLKD
jgi:DNA (cytosine-5)-methyltransferase 1